IAANLCLSQNLQIHKEGDHLNKLHLNSEEFDSIDSSTEDSESNSKSEYVNDFSDEVVLLATVLDPHLK
ncbi:13267_t:CDS:2, partial [Racocetra fulgida]